MPTRRFDHRFRGQTEAVYAADLPHWSTAMLAAARDGGEDVDAALAVANCYGTRLPRPGNGQTELRWQLLAAVAAAELTPARVLEAHADALAILAEADVSAAPGTWGVFAAEAAGVRLDGTHIRGQWRVTGTKPWCSLGDRLDHALVTANVDGGRALFAIDLHAPGVRAESSAGWVARGLRTVTSGPVHFDHVAAIAVGGRDWYLHRPGFAWGGIGVAACWTGGAIGVLDRLRRSAGCGPGADPILDLHIGIADAALYATSAALAEAARAVDGGQAHGPAGSILALRVRAIAAAAAETTIREANHALGPGPLAFEESYARRIADLELYVRQHHGESDLARLGHAITGMTR